MECINNKIIRYVTYALAYIKKLALSSKPDTEHEFKSSIKMAYIKTLLLTALVVLLVNEAVGKQVCNKAKCPAYHTCADPDYTVDTCCGDCSKSKCQFHGCVKFGEHGPTWHPTPCLTCMCRNGETQCTNITSTCPDCEGQRYRARYIEGRCCPVCDYGIADDACGLIRVRNHTIKVTMDDKVECITSVTKHGCDKPMFTRNNVRYRCKAIEGVRVVKKACQDVETVEYRDVIDCKPEIIPNRFAPHLMKLGKRDLPCSLQLP